MNVNTNIFFFIILALFIPFIKTLQTPNIQYSNSFVSDDSLPFSTLKNNHQFILEYKQIITYNDQEISFGFATGFGDEMKIKIALFYMEKGYDKVGLIKKIQVKYLGIIQDDLSILSQSSYMISFKPPHYLKNIGQVHVSLIDSLSNNVLSTFPIRLHTSISSKPNDPRELIEYCKNYNERLCEKIISRNQELWKELKVQAKILDISDLLRFQLIGLPKPREDGKIWDFTDVYHSLFKSLISKKIFDPNSLKEQIDDLEKEFCRRLIPNYNYLYYSLKRNFFTHDNYIPNEELVKFNELAVNGTSCNIVKSKYVNLYNLYISLNDIRSVSKNNIKVHKNLLQFFINIGIKYPKVAMKIMDPLLSPWDKIQVTF